MSRQKFSRALKREIAIEYMQSGKSRQEIALKYGLPNVNTLSAWVNSCLTPFEIKDKCVSLPAADHLSMQHVELFNYESFTLKTVENLFSSSRR